jgi:transposase
MSNRIDQSDVLLMSCSGFKSHDIEEDVMANGNRLSRGDKRRNERLARLRGLVPVTNAIVAFDLADERQVVVVCDHDSRVLARRRLTARAWELGPVLDWARQRAHRHGFTDVTAGCEPTGHRWRVLDQLAAERNIGLVCVQPLLVGRAREGEDYTRDKSDDKDAVLIARLIGQLRCYVPERPEATWARLRHLGARRARLIGEATGCVQQLRDLLECAWPAVLTAAAAPFDSKTWRAALAVVLERCNGDPQRLHRRGLDWFATAVRKELRARWGGQKIHRGVVRRVFAALTDHTGVAAQRHGGLERAGLVLADWRSAKARLADVEARMVQVLDHLDLIDQASSIPGVSPVGVAAILAETGDPSRFDSPRAVVKHAGLCPRDNSSGTVSGRSRISGRGRPGLRLAAWRAVWGAFPHNQVISERYRRLTTRADNPLTDGQARAALAAALLRWVHVIITQRISWNQAIAAGLVELPKAA